MRPILWPILFALLAGVAVAAQAQAPRPAIVDPAPAGRRVDEAGVFGAYFPAAGARLRPGVLLLGGSEGGLGPGTTRQARSLQAAGFDVLQVAYFGAPGEPAMLVDVPLETFTRAMAWLSSQPGVDRRRIGMVGGSKGAEAALLFASREPAIRAVVVGMPSSVVWPGISYTREMKPSWTSGGRGVPFLPYAPDANFANIFGVYDKALATLDAHPEAAIPAERIAGPILMICGKADTLWPSCPMAQAVAERLKRSRFRHPVQVLAYADAGHAVFGAPVEPSNPAYPTLASLGGTADGNNAARTDDWPRTIAFLKAALDR